QRSGIDRFHQILISFVDQQQWSFAPMQRFLRLLPALAILVAMVAAPFLAGASVVRAQEGSPASSPISCEVAPKADTTAAPTVTPDAAGTAAGELTQIEVGFVPVMVF